MNPTSAPPPPAARRMLALHGREIIIPYAMSGSATSFATVSLEELLAAME